MDNLSKDTVLEINTDDPNLAGKTITIKWSCSDISCNDASNYASVLFTEVYDDTGFKIQKLAFAPPSTQGTTEQNSDGFTLGTYNSGAVTTVNITLSPGTKIIRIKPLYFDIETLIVTLSGGTSFPSEDQGFDIYSTGCTCDNVLSTTSRANQSVRKVKVIKTREHLPAIFDYVLYSGSTTTPLEK